MQKEFPVINAKTTANPFCIAFVYTRDNGNFVVKGSSDEVVKYIERTWFRKCIYRYTFWLSGKSRGGWRASGRAIYFSAGVGGSVDDLCVACGHNHGRNWPCRSKPHRDSYCHSCPCKEPEWANVKTQNKYTIAIYSENKKMELHLRRIPHKWIPAYDQADFIER